jgi:hypothetical protein
VPPDASVLATGYGSALAIWYMARNATPVLKR